MHLINPACHINDIKTELQQSLGLISHPPSREALQSFPRARAACRGLRAQAVPRWHWCSTGDSGTRSPRTELRAHLEHRLSRAPGVFSAVLHPPAARFGPPVSVSASMNLCVSPFPGQGLRVPVMVTVPMVPLGTGVAVPEWG